MTSDTAARRVRQSPQERRKQLIAIGLAELTKRPLHQVTVDEVAARAGISRSLLFHYFPTKRDYYAEVLRAGKRRLLRATFGSGDGRPRTLDDMVSAYLEFIERRHEPYIAMFRTAGTDDWAREVFEETRAELVDGVLTVLDLEEASELVRAAVGAWLSFAEELCLNWAQHRMGAREQVLALLTGSLRAAVDLAT